MVLSIYRRFSESTNFCSKERLLRPVAMIDARACQNRQPVLFHSHPGQAWSLEAELESGVGISTEPALPDYIHIAVYYFLDVDSVIWLVEMCHMMLKYQVLFP